jgi:DNA gyrase subunit A
MLRLERTVDENGNDITFREDAGFVFFATRTGKVKKTALNEFRNYRKAGTIAIILEEQNELIGCTLTSGNNEVILVTHEGISLRFSEQDTRPLGRSSQGVMGIRPVEGDYVVGLALVEENHTLLVASENGLGKRTAFEEYRQQSRGGKGIITMKVTDKTGPLVGALSVEETHELMLMTSTGQSIRIRVNEIRETGRNAQGVKLLTLKPGEKLQDISLVIPDGEDAEGETERGLESAAEPEPPTEAAD